ncbi:SHOCT domain-containing protein [Streptacidiphilus melanogenes]|uniref:SHOCT domain-containing protein n=1 Tax=Streptacidiphilus melanogenes TaxID=411235 RepID=UPI0005A80789|nr:SHOCT domain-containing protein [Streptacidiphilus melanogenes]
MIGRPLARASRPGLIRTAGRTAVVAGTATAVSGRVARRQQERAEAAEAQAAPPPAPAPAAPAPAPASGGGPGDTIEALERLAALRQQGLLDDAEFAAAKAKLLGA